jgi:hypothetical protein
MKNTGTSKGHKTTPTIADLPKIKLRRGPLEVRATVDQNSIGNLMRLAMLTNASIEEALSAFLRDSDCLAEWTEKMAVA